MFPHLTRQQITMDGTWQITDHHHRLTGTLSSSAPFVILSLLNCGETYHYMKHTKRNDLDVSLVWYQMRFPLNGSLPTHRLHRACRKPWRVVGRTCPPFSPVAHDIWHIPTDLVVAQEASDVESSSRLDFL